MPPTRTALVSRSVRGLAGAVALGLTLGVAFSSCKSSGSDDERASQRGRPNILFIMSDDHAAQAISCYGSRINATPHIDRLAAEGVRFENCFATNAICGPSRASILTGLYSHRNGFAVNGDRFDGSQTTAPKQLRANGYQTAVVGKWHLGTEPTGFDHHVVLPGQGEYHDPEFFVNGERRRFEGYVTDLVTDFAIDWLEQERDPERPFYLMLHHKAPHRNWQPREDYREQFAGRTFPHPETFDDDYANRASPAADTEMTIDRHFTANDAKGEVPEGLTGDARRDWLFQRYMQDYLACVQSVDDNVGRVLEYLDRSGLAENTIVVYTSDQGFFLGEHGWYDKRWMYEESARMPLVVRWPAEIESGRVEERLALNVDFAPTFLDVAETAPGRPMQGASLRPLLMGRPAPDWRSSIYYRYYEYPQPHRVAPHRGVRTARHKLIEFPRTNEWELFDLERDPNELVSVYDDPAYASVRAELERELERLAAELGDDGIVWNPAAENAPNVPYELVLERAKLDYDGKGGDEAGSLDVAWKPFSIGAWVLPRDADGVIAAQGNEHNGWSLWIEAGVPHFTVHASTGVSVLRAPRALVMGSWAHVAAALDARGRTALFVDGVRVAEGLSGLLRYLPREPVSLGFDSGNPVGDYPHAFGWRGELRDLRLAWGPLTEGMLQRWSSR
jgi:arylsulfatase A-like enzyme